MALYEPMIVHLSSLPSFFLAPGWKNTSITRDKETGKQGQNPSRVESKVVGFLPFEPLHLLEVKVSAFSEYSGIELTHKCGQIHYSTAFSRKGGG